MKLMLDSLDNFNHIHLIGIGGVSMSAIAETLNKWGYRVTGSDATRSPYTDRLVDAGIKVTIGHDLSNSKAADLIIFSAAIKDTDPEMVLAKQFNIPTVTRGEFVGYLTKRYEESICVSGTHGKTTTTSMISLCFLEARLDPTIQVGATLKQINGNCTVGDSDYFILEACEYMENFLRFSPKTEIVLNIDNDHLDYFKTFDNIKKAFVKYAELLPQNGALITNADDSACLELKDHVAGKFITYGIENTSADYVAKNIKHNALGYSEFDVFCDSKFYMHVRLSVAGKHNVANALACIALCSYYEIDKNTIYSALLKFTGANRRLEYIGSYHNVSVYDDYGHHPTEITAVCKAIADKDFRESWVIFQPHTYSRTKNLLDEFARSLLGFDNIIVTDIYAAREQNNENISSVDLVKKIKEYGKDALYIKKFENIVSHIRTNAKANDLVLTLGAGTITQVGPEIIKP